MENLVERIIVILIWVIIFMCSDLYAVTYIGRAQWRCMGCGPHPMMHMGGDTINGHIF